MKRITLNIISIVITALLCASSGTTAVCQERRIDINALAARGEILANEDSLALELREQQPDGPSRRGFDIGMAAAEGQTEPGPGKQRIHDSLSPDEQPGYRAAVAFSLERNRNAEWARKGAAIAEADSVIGEARNAGNDVFYKLGFDIATGIFGDPALGAKGNTATGPGSLGIRNALSASGQRGFDDSVTANLNRRGVKTTDSRLDPRIPAGAGTRDPRIDPARRATIPSTTPAPEEPEYRELRCRGSYSFEIRVGDWYTGSNLKQMIVEFAPIYEPTDDLGSNLRPGACAFVGSKWKGAIPSEIHQVIVAYGQEKQVLKGTPVDTSPTAAERFPDAQNVPLYLKDSDHYWSFYVKDTGRGTLEANYGRFWKPSKPSRKLSPEAIRTSPRIQP